MGDGGFALDDGQGGVALLTAEDLGNRAAQPRIFFANACNSADTGAGADAARLQGGQETISLVPGLLRGGVRAFVGSMWRVDDRAAATFAKAFYATLLQAGRQDTVARPSVGEAVRAGREAVIRLHGAAQPAWAAYALYGVPWVRAV